jgi:putative Mn2+ efflux pump MntP
MKNIIWNTKEKSIRGSFVNLCITLFVVVLITAGCFSDVLAERLDKMSSVIVGFFVASMGIWSVKKGFEGYRNESQDNYR